MAGSSSENDDAQRQNRLNMLNSSSPFGRRHFPRDSGCYEGSPVPAAQNNSSQNMMLQSCDANSLDDVVTQCSTEILKRVENARRSKEEKCPLKGVSRVAKKGLLGGSGADESICSRGALSEKSSDSGVSSSSLSSGPMKNNN